MTDDVTEPNCEPYQVRTSQEIATRALTLFGVVALGLGASREKIIPWLRDEGLCEALTPRERELVDSETPTQKQLINASWQSEALLVLLWVLRKVDDLPPGNVQCDTALFRQLMPPYADILVKDFVRLARRRSDEELTNQAILIQEMHWKARDAAIHGTAAPQEIDIEIVQERHHAINWVIGYERLSWDEVTTDT